MNYNWLFYELCKYCDHFIALEINYEDQPLFTHLEDDDYQYDHVPSPSGLIATIDTWKWLRPDLFVKHSGHIGPNWKLHVMGARNV